MEKTEARKRFERACQIADMAADAAHQAAVTARAAKALLVQAAKDLGIEVAE